MTTQLVTLVRPFSAPFPLMPVTLITPSSLVGNSPILGAWGSRLMVPMHWAIIKLFGKTT